MNELNVIDRAPAVFGVEKATIRSDSYDFISTEQIMSTFKDNNWAPQYASQRKLQTKNKHLTNFAKHLVTFQNPDLPSVNGVFPQINVINAHDGSSSFIMMAGLYRFVCQNGLIVSDAEFDKIKIRHRFLNPEVISESIKQIVDVVPEIIGKADNMMNTKLSEIDKLNFSDNVIKGVWKDPDVRPFEPIQLLETRRQADAEPNLWNTYNTVQENLMKGGLIGTTTTNKQRKMRGITNIEKTVSVNQLLWSEANEFLQAA